MPYAWQQCETVNMPTENCALSALGLMQALPDLLQVDDAQIKLQLEAYYKAEDEDNSVASPVAVANAKHPVDIFRAAYLRLVKTEYIAVFVSLSALSVNQMLL